jgi:exodeoxyribonuclease V alpha subunit
MDLDLTGMTTASISAIQPMGPRLSGRPPARKPRSGARRESADAIAMRLGIEKTAMIRLRAGISYALTEAMDEGHCGLPTDQLIPLAEELLEAPKELILTALELERSDGAVIADKVGDTACTFLAGLYRAEQVIADRLIRIVNGRLPWTWIDEEKALPWVEKRSGLQLADSQRSAIRLALTAKALVITGGPGGRQDDYRQFNP